MGIDDIHILFPCDDDDHTTQVRKKAQAVSRHEVEMGEKRYVFGWDQPLMSFFLQVHDLIREEDDQVVVRLGADEDTQMYEVEELVRAAAKHGLNIDHSTQVKLFGEKDDGV